MAHKGSKYARKHKQENAKPEAMHTKESEKNEDIWEIIYNPDNFTTKFLSLPYDRQIEMIVTLNRIIEQSYNKSLTQIEKVFVQTAEKHLDRINEMTNSSYDEGIYSPLATDEKKLIRMDCYGSINKRSKHQLSHLYMYFCKNQKGNFKLSEYDMESSPSWKLFMQFESFRKITSKVKKYLYTSKINPEALKVMTVSDFCDVIFNAFKENDRAESAYFITANDDIKHRQIKSFMKYQGEAFQRRLIEKGIDERLVKSLCNAMKRFGVCELSVLSVVETHYTPRIITDLGKAKYDVSNIKVGDKIPQEFIDELIDSKKESLILARDENGYLLDKSVLPRLEMHHKKAVRFAANQDYIAKVNYPNNLVLVDALMHAKFYHLFDKIIKQNDIQTIYSRLNIDSRIMSSIIGFDIQDATYYDMEQTAAFRKREQEDKKYVVKYHEVMEERLYNEMNLVQKYGLPYSSSSIAKGSNSLKELTGSLGLDAEKMKVFKAWLKGKKKGR